MLRGCDDIHLCIADIPYIIDIRNFTADEIRGVHIYAKGIIPEGVGG
jgi:hypothetical protein